MRYGPCLATITCTYSPALSKNARLKRSFRGRLYIAAPAKAAEARLERELKTALKDIKFYQNKVFLDIYVVKTRVNSDALNFIDALADCLKRVIMVDDRYYGIKGLDYELNKAAPKIVLKLYQPDRFNAV